MEFYKARSQSWKNGDGKIQRIFGTGDYKTQNDLNFR